VGFPGCYFGRFAYLEILPLAIMYLESKRKVHSDISYTNILLREPGVDKPDKKATRDQIMALLGLSEIDKLRKQLGCREGLLIDFDYVSPLVELTGLLEPETGQNGSGAGQDQQDQGDQGDQGDQDADEDEDQEDKETTAVLKAAFKHASKNLRC
jgi:serine/threonine protein kinase